MLTVVDTVHPAWGSETAQGLRKFADPPGWLLAIDDPDQISAALVKWIPELESRQMLRECEVERVRLRDDVWTGQYRLVISDGQEDRTVDLRGRLADGGAPLRPGPNSEPFGSQNWSCYAPELRLEFRLLPPEGTLTSLPALTDPERARLLLERGIRESSPKYRDVRIESCMPRVMRYKPGSRCTVLYEVHYAPSTHDHKWPSPVVAKTHHGEKGLNAHKSMTALWNSPLGQSRNVTIAEPLGFLPDENVLLQGPIKEEKTLKQQLRLSIAEGGRALDQLRSYLELTARGLADLHGCGVTVGRQWTFEDELNDVRGRVSRLAAFAPELEGAGDPLLARLEGIASAFPADAIGPSHRSFRPAQVLIHGDAIGFIDFDSFCQAEPALDLALFFATFRDLSLRALQARDGAPAAGEHARHEHLALLDDLCHAFLGAYLDEASVSLSVERVDLWHALLLFDRIVTCWTKDRFERLPHCVSLLTHHYAKDGLIRLVA